MRSHDVGDQKRQELLRLFPEARTERDTLDFERLRLALGEAVDVRLYRFTGDAFELEIADARTDLDAHRR